MAFGPDDGSRPNSTALHDAVWPAMLYRPWCTAFIVLFWCTTTGWLVTTKILPAFRSGAAPGYQALYVADATLTPVGWTVEWNDRPVGWALTELERVDDGGLVVASRLRFDRLPIGQILPGWAAALMPVPIPDAMVAQVETRGRMDIDAAGRLRRFSSIVRLPPGRDEIALEGTCRDGSLTMTVRAGDLRYEVNRQLPSGVTLGDEFTPQAMLPGLYEGRRWSVPIYNPLRAARSPLEILLAEVGPQDILYWDNRLVRVDVVSYREDSAAGDEPRCRLWVDKSGRVLKQEASILGARLAFVRRSDEATAWLHREMAAAEAAREPSRPPKPPIDPPPMEQPPRRSP